MPGSIDFDAATMTGDIPAARLELVKASGSEVDTGTDDAKFVTAKAINDSHNVPDVAPGTSGNRLTSNGADWVSGAPTPDNYGFGVDGGGTALTTQTIHVVRRAKRAGTITGWSIGVDAGTATVKFWKIAAGTAIPTVSNVINTNGVAISSGTFVRSTTVSDFTTVNVAAGDLIMCVISAIATATWIAVELETTPT